MIQCSFNETTMLEELAKYITAFYENPENVQAYQNEKENQKCLK